MDYTTLVPESKEGQDQLPKGMQSLYEVCQEVADGRKARGKRYDVAGMQSLLGASDWIRDQASLLRDGLHLSWKRMPCANTYSYALARLDSQQVNAAPLGLVRAEGGRKPVWKGTEPFSGAAKRVPRPSGRGW